ncbi:MULTISPECIES: maleylpyruvate isomerase family mycothiol-dependent enzyme [unclassified Streptomyces]|uniref:maleylpyruvate isomerase family mycothiol-dependent enzyme n=1 Tax=unclassified Streptomyces TaxID=2593676 RepID=UPI0033A420E0
MTDVRDPELPGLLLRTERDALIPFLRKLPDEAFAVRTCCPGWTVRHVLAHCAAALTRVVEDRFEEGVFSPEANDRDIEERAGLANAAVVDELERGMTDAGPVIAKAADGRLDGIAFGEWVHAGDVREALGEPGAYAGAGLAPALDLLAAVTRARATPPLHADLDDLDEPVLLGAATGEHPPARYIGPASTLIRLYAARPLTGTRYDLAGVREAELALFG